MTDREGMWTTANGDTIVWQPSIRQFIRMRDGKEIDKTRSEAVARRWIIEEGE